jgi:hypothetical protein
MAFLNDFEEGLNALPRDPQKFGFRTLQISEMWIFRPGRSNAGLVSQAASAVAAIHAQKHAAATAHVHISFG